MFRTWVLVCRLKTVMEWEVCFFGGRGGSAPKASRGFAAPSPVGCGSMYLWNSFHPMLGRSQQCHPIGWSHQELIRERDMKEELWPRPSWLVGFKKVNRLLLLNPHNLGANPRFVWTHVMMAVGIPHSFIPLLHEIHEFMGSKLMAELWQCLFFEGSI